MLNFLFGKMGSGKTEYMKKLVSETANSEKSFAVYVKSCGGNYEYNYEDFKSSRYVIEDVRDVASNILLDSNICQNMFFDSIYMTDDDMLLIKDVYNYIGNPEINIWIICNNRFESYCYNEIPESLFQSPYINIFYYNYKESPEVQLVKIAKIAKLEAVVK